MTTPKRFILALALCCLAVGGVMVAEDRGLVDTSNWPGVQWLTASKPTMAIVVRESSTVNTLTKEQIAWLNSPDLAKACRDAKIELHVVDPQVQDRDGKTPEALAKAIDAAKKAGLPRLVLVGSRGGVTCYALPKDEAAAHSRILGK